MSFTTSNTHRVTVSPIKNAGVLNTIMKSKALLNPELDYVNIVVASLDRHDRCRIAIPVFENQIILMNVFTVVESSDFDSAEVNAEAKENLDAFLSELKTKGCITESEIQEI